MALYDADGRRRVTLLGSFSTHVGLYAADGSYNAHESPGTASVGMYAPDGALYVTLRTVAGTGAYAPDGSLYIAGSDPYYIANNDQELGVPSGGAGTPEAEFNDETNSHIIAALIEW